MMRSISPRAWVLVLLSSALQILMFPVAGPVSPWLSALAWIALAPLLVALSMDTVGRQAISFKNAVKLGYMCGVLWYMGNCFWIYQTMYLYGGLAKPVGFCILILFSLYLGLYHALFAFLFVCVRRSRFGVPGALLAAPFAWVAVELARARITGFPWDLLGNTQVENLLVTRIAPIAGVMGISFLLASVSAGVAAFFAMRGRRRALIASAAVLLALVLQALHGLHRDATPSFADEQLAVMLQENLSVGVTAKQDQPVSEADELAQFALASLHPATPGASAPGGAHVTLIIWPEAPSNLFSSDPYFRAQMGALARSVHVPIVAGSLGVDTGASAAQGTLFYDSANLFDAGGSYQGRYDKVHLVPWGEYVPFKQLFSFADRLTAGVGNMEPGRGRSVFQSGGHTYGVFICYESIFGDEVREFVQHGAEVLVNISDDGWYGDTGAPWQHLNMARMRAIENHRWVLRSTNTGVTTAIDPWGRMAHQAPRHVRAAFAFPFQFEQGTTFYTRHGDWFAYLCTLVTLGAASFSFRRPVN